MKNKPTLDLHTHMRCSECYTYHDHNSCSGHCRYEGCKAACYCECREPLTRNEIMWLREQKEKA